MSKRKDKAAGKPSLPAEVREAANRWALHYWSDTVETEWRAVLLEGLLRLMREREALVADLQLLPENPEHANNYLHGVLPRGLAAAALNELAMYCEDLFALLRAMHHRGDFAREILGYRGGTVTRLGQVLRDADDDTLLRAFYVPPVEIICDTADADNTQVVQNLRHGMGMLLTQVREIAGWYFDNAASHTRYKHGLQVHLRTFGDLPDEEVEKRRTATAATVITMTNQQPSSGRGGLMFQAPDELLGYLGALYQNELLLRVEMQLPATDLVDLARLGWVVAGLQHTLVQNRLAVLDGPDATGQQDLWLPNAERRSYTHARWEPAGRPTSNFNVRL